VDIPTITIPEVVPYLLAVLALLFVWQLYVIQVRAGRVQTVDVFNRSRIRLFIHVTPDDSLACPVCREANGMGFLPHVVAAQKFRPMDKTCANPAGCRCLMVGLYGAWPEAARVQAEMHKHSGRIQLSKQEMIKLVEGAQARQAAANEDQVSLAILEAMRTEEVKPEVAIAHYTFVVDKAQTDRDLALVVPAYIRMTDLFERTGRREEALGTVERFFKAYGNKRQGPHVPTEDQFSFMSLRRTHLMAVHKQAQRAHASMKL
jgi:hypothetical protein